MTKPPAESYCELVEPGELDIVTMRVWLLSCRLESDLISSVRGIRDHDTEKCKTIDLTPQHYSKLNYQPGHTF